MSTLELKMQLVRVLIKQEHDAFSSNTAQWCNQTCIYIVYFAATFSTAISITLAKKLSRLYLSQMLQTSKQWASLIGSQSGNVVGTFAEYIQKIQHRQNHLHVT